MPIARFDYSLGDNDKRNIEFSKRILREVWEGAP